jgi:hypothetical protein
VAPAASATAIIPAASQSATPTIDADAGGRAQTAGLDASADVGDAKAPTLRPAAHAPKHRPAAARQTGIDDER